MPTTVQDEVTLPLHNWEALRQLEQESELIGFHPR